MKNLLMVLFGATPIIAGITSVTSYNYMTEQSISDNNDFDADSSTDEDKTIFDNFETKDVDLPTFKNMYSRFNNMHNTFISGNAIKRDMTFDVNQNMFNTIEYSSSTNIGGIINSIIKERLSINMRSFGFLVGNYKFGDDVIIDYSQANIVTTDEQISVSELVLGMNGFTPDKPIKIKPVFNLTKIDSINLNNKSDNLESKISDIFKTALKNDFSGSTKTDFFMNLFLQNKNGTTDSWKESQILNLTEFNILATQLLTEEFKKRNLLSWDSSIDLTDYVECDGWAYADRAEPTVDKENNQVILEKDFGNSLVTFIDFNIDNQEFQLAGSYLQEYKFSSY